MMLDMKRTFDEVVLAHTDPKRAEEIFANPFYQAMSSTFSGTQEYMRVLNTGVVDMPDTRLPHLPDGDLDVIVARFGLAEIRDMAYLSSGLINRNWRITTDRNRYALKQ